MKSTPRIKISLNSRWFILKEIIVSAWLCTMITVAMQAAAKPTMRAYSIDLPGHVLRFSLPEEIALGMTPNEVEKRFDPLDPAYFRNGFREIAGTMYDFKGPFWVGAYGSLKFDFSVMRRKSEYQGDITTIETLDGYVRWWINIGKHAKAFTFDRNALNGKPAVRRWWNTFAEPRVPESEHLEIFSLPLDEEMFLDVGFNIMEWKGGRGKAAKWKAKAEEMREAIKATIVLEPKTSNPRHEPK